MIEKVKNIIEKTFHSKLDEKSFEILEKKILKKEAEILIFGLKEEKIYDLTILKEIAPKNMILLKKFGDITKKNIFSICSFISFNKSSIKNIRKKSFFGNNSILKNRFYEIVKNNFEKKSGLNINNEKKIKIPFKNKFLQKLTRNKLNLIEIENILKINKDFFKEETIIETILENINLKTRFEMLNSNIFDPKNKNLKIKFNKFIKFLKSFLNNIEMFHNEKIIFDLKKEIKKIVILLHIRGYLKSFF